MLMKLWQMLVLYLALGIVDGEKAGGDGGDGGGEGDDAGAGGGDGGDAGEAGGEGDLPDDDLDSLIETVEKGGGEEGEKAGGRENEAIRAARKRAQKAEEARIRAEATLETERRMRTPPQASEDQRLFEAEEARLRDTEVPDIEKWQIRSNRTLRANTQAANRAMSTAADMQDQSAFARLEISNPKVFKLYSTKVEKALADMRAKGQDAPRLALLRFLIGNDVIEGNLKSSTGKKAAAATAGKQAAGVDRGRSPGARSDVSGKGKTSEHDKRKERLRNVPI
jgi:hypothetical protein